MCVGSIAIHEDMVNVEILNTAPFLGKDIVHTQSIRASPRLGPTLQVLPVLIVLLI